MKNMTLSKTETENGKLKMKDKVECANDKYKGKHEEIQAIGGVLVADKLLEEFEKENELEKGKAVFIVKSK